MMDVQQVIALAVVAAAALLLVRRYAPGHRKRKFKQCADCPAAAAHSPAEHSGVPGPPTADDITGKT